MTEQGPAPKKKMPPAPDTGPKSVSLKERILSILKISRVEKSKPSPAVSSPNFPTRVLQDLRSTVTSTLFWIGVLGSGVSTIDWISGGQILTELKKILEEMEKDNQKVFPGEKESKPKILPEITPAEESSPEVPIVTIKDDTMAAALKNIRDTFGSATIDKQILILKDRPNAMDFCTFNDGWAQTSKEELDIMYKYLDQKMEKNPEAKKALLGNLFETLIHLKKGMEGGILTRLKAHKIPVNEVELQKKIEDFVNSPAKNQTSCGMGFRFGFSLLGNEGHAQIQKLVVEFIKTLSSSILEDLNSQDENVKKIARERYVTLINLIEKARSVKLKTKSR